MEIWKPIPSAPGHFASDMGRISGVRVKVLKGTLTGPNRKRRFTVGIKGRRRTVHSLVCEAFHGPRPEGYLACHWDDEPTNNVPSNLRWATYAENAADSIRNGTFPVGERSGRAKITEEQVSKIKQQYAANMGARYVKRGTRERLSLEFNVPVSAIKDIMNGRAWRHVVVDIPFLPPPDEAQP